MKFFLSSRLVQKGGRALGNVVLGVQHLLMKAAIAISLKLCLYTAQILLSASDKERTGEAL